MSGAGQREAGVESRHAWIRLGVAILLATIGCVGMWSVVVVLPAVQAEFLVDRADASLPYTLVMVGFGAGGVLAGRLTDRHGTFRPVCAGILLLSLGYAALSQAPGMASFAVIYGAMVGVGSSVLFAPLVADISHWFDRRRGIAVALCASGNYFSGAVWPPFLQQLIETVGWRQTHLWIGVICLVTMLPLALVLRRRLPAPPAGTVAARAEVPSLGLPPNVLQALLIVAGVACCVAMAMPQVHIVAYCGELGYGVARGAEMLSLMLACGIASRIASGFIADRIGGLGTLLLGSVLQALALLLYLFFDGLASLYVISALFGLFQGGIVPSYAIIVREHFPPAEAGTRVGIVLMSTLVGMALGGWMSGVVFDLSGSYAAAFLNGIAWNALNVLIVAWLILRVRGAAAGPRPQARPA